MVLEISISYYYCTVILVNSWEKTCSNSNHDSLYWFSLVVLVNTCVKDILTYIRPNDLCRWEQLIKSWPPMCWLDIVQARKSTVQPSGWGQRYLSKKSAFDPNRFLSHGRLAMSCCPFMWQTSGPILPLTELIGTQVFGIGVYLFSHKWSLSFSFSFSFSFFSSQLAS